MIKTLKAEISIFTENIKTLDKKVLIIFLSLAILQTISWYYTSRRFFRKNLLYYFRDYPYSDLLNFVYWFIGDFITYFILPVLIIKLIFKEKTSNYGLQAGNYKSGLKLTVFFAGLMILIIWFISSDISFNYTYPQLFSARENWLIFLIFEAGMLLYMFAWEFIWRGYILFGLEKKFGYYSVMIQMIPFVILHNGKPELETFSSIIGGIALGVLALRTRSFLYGFFIHAAVIFSIDFISVIRYRTGQFGIGLNSFISIFRSITGV